jgi:ATP diphosphatase
MDDIPAALPSLARAAKVQRRAASVGFDWPATPPVIAKLQEEVDELEMAEDASAREHEVGDLLFTIVNLCRHLDVDPEMALRQAVDRFGARFRWMEQAADLSGLALEELDRLWERAKDSAP